VEAGALVGLLAVVTVLALWNSNTSFPYVIWPVLIAITLRFRLLGATVSVLFVSWMGAIFTAHGHGPFSSDAVPLHRSYLLLASFILLTSGTVLILAAVLAELEGECEKTNQEKERAKLAETQAELMKNYAAAVRAENLAESQELQDATVLQLSLLPMSLPPTPGLEVAARMQSARQVGGDYYNVLPRTVTGERPSFLFCVADVSGKGFIASLLMSTFQQMLLMLSEQDLKLGEIAARLSARIAMRPNNRYVTSIMVQLDSTSAAGRYVSAGHTNGIIVTSEGLLKYLPSTKFPLGMFTDVGTGEENFSLEEGDMLALFTDGFTDALNPVEQEFSEDRLADYLCRNHNEPALKIVSGAFAAVNGFSEFAPAFDDMTLMIVKRSAAAAA
jgi:serine phosphatase RsbU (regulator of sigma subunit)